MKRGRPATATAAALTLLLAGCGGGNAGDNTGAAISPGDEYVALGDSYTSAPGAGAGTGDPACQQTIVNYPHRLAAALELDLVDVSCGSAWTTQLTLPQKVEEVEVPPQADALTEDTSLVTLSLGANNNAVIPGILFTCVPLAIADPQGSPCRDVAESDPEAYDAVFEGITNQIVKAVAEVGERAPRARVVVVGYPQIFPEKGGCSLFPVAAGDRRYAYQVLLDLVRAVGKGARKAGVEFLDLWPASEGHDICSDDPWMAGASPAPGRLAEPYHPYAEGQQAVADLLVELLGDKPTERPVKSSLSSGGPGSPR